MDSSLRSHVAAPSAKRLVVFGGVGLLVVAILLLAYFGTEIRANERKAPKGPAAIPVSIAPVLQEVVPFRLLAIGNVEAYATVSVKARVDGQIVEVGFKEGEELPRGRVLFKNDPRPYRRLSWKNPNSAGEPRQGERYPCSGGDQPGPPDLRKLLRAGAAARRRSRLHVLGAARGRRAGPGVGSTRSLGNAGLRR